MQREQFEALIAGLEATGISRAQIARECQVSRMTIWRLAEGVVHEPSWSTGHRIQNLAVERGVTPMIQKIG